MYSLSLIKSKFFTKGTDISSIKNITIKILKKAFFCFHQLWGVNQYSQKAHTHTNIIAIILVIKSIEAHQAKL